MILCWIAHIGLNGRRHWGSELFRPAIAMELRDHDARDEHLFSLFQVF